MGDTQSSHTVTTYCPSVQLIHQSDQRHDAPQSQRRKISEEIHLAVSAATIRFPLTVYSIANVLKAELNDFKHVYLLNETKMSRIQETS